MSFEINGKTYETDEEGYLLNLADWTPEAAAHLAEEEKVPLTDNHWEVINFLRDYYNEYQIAPAVRVLTEANSAASTLPPGPTSPAGASAPVNSSTSRPVTPVTSVPSSASSREMS